MKLNSLLCLAAAALIVAGCGKSKAPAAATPATPATPTAPTTQTSQAPSPPPADQSDPALAAKQAAVQRALAEQEILDDPKGQWAATAKASSRYQDAPDGDRYSPQQATGKPDIERPGDNVNAWAAATADGGIEWLEIGFSKPVHATEVRVRQNVGPGAIIKLELIDDQGGRHTVFSGIDQTKYEANELAWFKQVFDKTPYPVVGARLTFAMNSVPGWNEVDAVQLVGD